MIVRLAIEAMRTRFEIALAGDDADASYLRAAGEEALAEIREIEARLNRFDRASIVADINRRAVVEAVRVDTEMIGLLARCLLLRDQSRGAFDITVGGLMEHLGFHDVADAREDVRGAVGRLRVDAGASTVRLEDPGVSLDMGGIGKGVALDAAAECLRDADVESALLHGGTSSVVAIGTPPDESGWRIALGESGAVAVLRDVALSVSAPDGRTSGDGARGHILDPRTGESVATRLGAVIAGDAALADAWSTAILVDRRLADTNNAPPGVYATLVHDGHAFVTAGDVGSHLDLSAMESIP